MAENIEVARAFVTIVPTMQGAQAELTKELTGVTSEASAKAGEEGGSKFSEKFAGVIKGAGVAIGAAVTAATGAAIATGKAFLNAADNVAQFGNDIDKNAQKMQMSATGYQEWSFILEHTGASIEGMKTSMKRLVTAAEEGNSAFDALGISQEQLANMSPEETWNATISALQKVTDEGQRTALASQLLGKGAVELAPLFNTTAEATEAMRQQVHDLGGVMSDEAVKASANYKDEMQNMNTALQGVKRNMMSQFLPGISQVMKGISLVFSGNGGVGEVKQGLQSIISNITAVAPQFFSLAQTLVMSLLEGFGPMLPQLATTIFSVLNQALVTVVTMLPQLLPAITSGIAAIMQSLFECLPIITASLFTLIGDLVTWLSDTTNIESFVNGIVDLTAQIAGQMSEILPVLLPAIIKIIGTVANTLMSPQNIATIVKAVLQIAAAVFVALVNCVPELIDFVVGVFKNIGGYIKAFGGDFLKNAATWIASVLVKVGTFAKDIVGKVKNLPSELLNIGKNLVTGLWNGINDKLSWVTNKIRGMGSSITSAIKKVFGIHSPSKIWKEQVGSMLALGIGEGFTSEMDNVKEDMAQAANGLTASMSTEVTAYGAQGAAVYEGGGNTYNGGAININVYGAEGQSVEALAEAVAIQLQILTGRREALFA